ncbi:MAG: methyltransferase [Buchnera aphidicola (Periphyllus aceris)]|nr:methyltransferase [Buchnera aphidicola (Periphyllus aceris)]
MNLSSTSKLIFRLKNIFIKKKVLFSGYIKDSLPEILKTKKTGIHIQKYNFLKYFKKNIKINFFINYLIKKKNIKKYNTVIYYFSKNKKESYFHIKNILSLINIKSTIFIVGENNSGINSFVKFYKKKIHFNKLNYGKKCTIYFHIVTNRISFKLKNFFKTNYWKNFQIKFLPGVFGYKKIDKGSKLLVSTFLSKEIFNKKVLDIGAGSGFLSIIFLKFNNANKITMSDVCLKSIKCCKKNFYLNKLTGIFIESDLYSNINKKFDLIISNPPLHENLKKSLFFLKKIIKKSVFYLKKNGELRIVVNKYYSCIKYFKKTFKKYKILKENKNFRIYQGFKN